MLKVDLILSN